MESGRVVAVGEHLELLESCRPYNEYCQNVAANGTFSICKPYLMVVFLDQYTRADSSFTEKEVDIEVFLIF